MGNLNFEEHLACPESLETFIGNKWKPPGSRKETKVLLSCK